jgi:DNA-3-methyladenine glycosylase II
MAFVLRPDGPFSLAAAAAFAEGFPATDARAADGGGFVLAFAVDGDWRTVGVALSADGDAVRGEVTAPPELEARVAEEVRAILSLDVDGRGYPDVGRRDPVVGRLQAAAPGLRPVLFWSPYEAAAWTIIGQRIRMAQARGVKLRLAEELGEAVEIGGTTVPAFPTPERLAALPADQPGLTTRKEEQLRALGRAALEGALDRRRLRSLPPEAAAEALQALPGIGPFSAELIRIRGAGDPDALAVREPRLQRIVRARYGLPEDAPLGETELTTIAEPWRPYRAWVTLLLRAAGAG